MKKLSWIMLSSVLLTFACAPQTGPLYKWEDYSSSLYNLKKHPSEESLKQHKTVLLKIIEESKSNGLHIPPGVCCEYGYALLKEGQNDEALKYLDMEEQVYPETKVFIQHLKMHAAKAKEQK